MLGAHPRFAILIYIFDRYVCIYKVEDFVVRKIFAEKNLGLDNIFADLCHRLKKVVSLQQNITYILIITIAFNISNNMSYVFLKYIYM